MAALVEQWLDAIEQFYGTYSMYSTQWAQYFFTIPTITFILTVIAICTPALVALFLYELEEAHLRASQPASCRKLGLNTESNLQNEFDPKFSEGQPPNSKEASPAAWRVKSIWIYPVKSCRGVELEEGTVIATGMEYDRQFSFAQLKDGPAATAHEPGKEGRTQKWEFITQRQYRLLATVKTEMWVPDKSVERYTHHAEEVESGGVVVLSFPYQEPGWRGILAKLRAALRGTVPEKRFRVPFDPSPAQIEKAGYTFEQMTIWKDTASALNLSVEVPPELSTYLGMTNRLGLFRVDNSRLREVHRNAPRKEELGYQPVTGFQDAYPLHLLNLASVHALSALISSSPSPQSQPTIPPPLPLSATRFRANIILTGPPAFAEDTFRLIHIGSTALAVCCRTARCKMPNVHPITGERHASEPDRTLRRERAVDRGAGKGVGCLGVQMVAMVDGRGLVRVGDGVVVKEWGESEYIPQ